ncbi:MAG: 50S ribosomal protein L25/general stress protein Ctc [Rhodospirillaceae bacterium]|jgi:large subunit ribosomal protein L25|nr:50S ribosomal protein L25/general stress protein Ctc [Rhodospirillaceae bacterium]MBT6204683.1 50S ribosomal protein L25/general stress protein Ctc [Rhodospirillaceae bacterium]MBT6512920.1 50S ribosomal protein L25/general stress protein Ctc [Rhodospirillaceae bacterium]MBT7645594.1 50S ribosomal protein L25/general stress protein Ctc [Rhodospirillaceae bacterium]
MADQATITAELRETSGTGAARATRRDGMVPGIVYGADHDNIMISVARDALDREAHQQGFFAQLFKLKVGGKSLDVLARDLQLHPVTDSIMHVDFLAVKADATIAVNIPVVFLNEEECEGLKRGGVLNIVRHEVELLCPANAIPESIEIDLAGHDIGDSIHISSVTLPDGVTPTIDDRDFTIVTLAAPTVQAEVEEGEGLEEGMEGEVVEGAEGEGEGEESGEDVES